MDGPAFTHSFAHFGLQTLTVLVLLSFVNENYFFLQTCCWVWHPHPHVAGHKIEPTFCFVVEKLCIKPFKVNVCNILSPCNSKKT